MEIGDKLILDIIDINTEGRGVAKKDRLIFFVEGAILNERLEAKIVGKKKNFYQAKKIKTVETSPYLEDARCPYADICDGCNFQNIEYERQKKYKKDLVIATINKIAREDLEDIDFIGAENRYGYRNKLELKVDYRGQISYFSRSSNSHIAIDKCIIADDKINDLLVIVQDAIREYGLRGYDNKKDLGLIKNIIVRATSLGESMLVFVMSQEGFKDKDNFYDYINKKAEITSIYQTVNNRKNNYKIGKKLELISGKDKISDKIKDRYFYLSPRSFFQVNTKMTEKLYRRAFDYVKETNPINVIDLYSGTGTTSILLAKEVEKIDSVEIVADAVKDARRNAKINSIDNINWINDAAENVIGDLDINDRRSTVLFDPPRKGLDPKIIDVLGESSIDSIVYISCNPATLARDIYGLKGHGFKLDKVAGVDMFVNTLHVETVVLMTR